MTLRHSALLLLLSPALLAGSPAVADDTDEPGPAELSRPQAKPGSSGHAAGVVRLTEAQQKAGGLMVEVLQPVSFQPESAAYGKVLDIQPLLELRLRYRAALADAEVAGAALDLAQRNRDRLSALHREDIVAGRELVQAEAQWQSDRAKEQAARRMIRQIRQEAQQAWGAALTRLALDEDAALIEELVSHRRSLLLVALPPGLSLGIHRTPLFVSRNQDRGQAVAAVLVSAAPRTDELVQGETWFFHAPGEPFRAGMRVQVWVPVGGENLRGVAIPPSAVVWHAGRPWAYRQTDGDSFVRTELTGYREFGAGWFLDRGFAPGQRIVVSGAQMLLSEEFRGQIPDEDDD